MGVWLRNKLYDVQVFKSKKFSDVKVISVGNLCVGGAGKTPHVESLIKLLKNDFKVATLSRGYKRKTSGYFLADESSTAESIGDEPMLFHKKYPDIKVAVDAKRVRGIENLLKEEEKPEVIILDDAFQHRAVKPGMNILLTDYTDLFIHDTYLPAGRLREAKTNSFRADIIIVTKTPHNATNVDLKSVIKDIKPWPYQKLFFSYIKYGHLYHAFDMNNTIKPEMDLFKYNVVSFSGIANHKPFHTFIKEYANDVDMLVFPDHHEYTDADLTKILERFAAIQGQNKIIITTEKDIVKLTNGIFAERLSQIPIYVLPIEIDLKNKTEEFNELILKYVRANRIYHKKYSEGNE